MNKIYNIPYEEIYYSSTQKSAVSGSIGFGVRTYTTDMPTNEVNEIAGAFSPTYPVPTAHRVTQAQLVQSPEIVLDYPISYEYRMLTLGDGTKRTFLLAFFAGDASCLTGLDGNGTFVLVDTRHIDAAALGTFLSQLDNAARTSLRTRAASRTFLFVDLGQTRLGVDVDSIKLTGIHTVATAQTAIAAARLASAAGMDGSTGTQTVVVYRLWSYLTRAVASHHRNLRFAVGNSHSQQVGHLAHHLAAAHRTVQTIDAAFVGTLSQCVGHTSAAGKATTSAVGARQQRVNLSNARVFLDSKFSGADIKHGAR